MQDPFRSKSKVTDERIEIDSKIVERAIGPQSIVRKNGLFAVNDGSGRPRATIATLVQRQKWIPSIIFSGSDRLADRAAFMVTFIMSVKLNNVHPQALRADVLANNADTMVSRAEQLLPWNFASKRLDAQAV